MPRQCTIWVHFLQVIQKSYVCGTMYNLTWPHSLTEPTECRFLLKKWYSEIVVYLEISFAHELTKIRYNFRKQIIYHSLHLLQEVWLAIANRSYKCGSHQMLMPHEVHIWGKLSRVPNICSAYILYLDVLTKVKTFSEKILGKQSNI